MRALERRLMRRVGLVLTSSPGFVNEYFQPHGQTRVPIRIVENKCFYPEAALPAVPTRRPVAAPITIGWFGILRCAWSLDCLDRVTRAAPGRYRVLLRGKPALDQLPQFHATVAANPDLDFGGPYRNPEDLADIYGQVHLSWLIDRYDAGKNSDWLLPNRLYEGCRHHAVPVALAGTEVANFLGDYGLGLTIAAPDAEEVGRRLGALSRRGRGDEDGGGRSADAGLDHGSRGMSGTHGPDGPDRRRPRSQAAGGDASERLVHHMTARVLIVIPTLNEAAHIGGVLDTLLPFAERHGARIVVADGGSTDGTRALVTARPEPGIVLLDNPRRLQSAAINLAVEHFGDEADWLIRIDAHSAYPADYCDVLLAEAQATGADSVVVGMKAVGSGFWQSLIAAAQNSRIGNGGSAHRVMPVGKFVDHGHHALMRIAAFREVGGYDESFSHNEDAELDLRLGNAGFRIWLTPRTRVTYFPDAASARW